MDLLLLGRRLSEHPLSNLFGFSSLCSSFVQGDKQIVSFLVDLEIMVLS